jgi:outer membrane protein W
MNGKVAAFAAVGMLLAGQAHAGDAAMAQMSAVKGSVVVSQNGKFVQASSATALKAGDRVVAKDGQASLKFADGCTVSLKPNAMLTVGAASPCASGAGLVSATQGDSAQLLGLSGFGAAVTTFAILGLILIAAGESGDENTVSP